MLGRLLARATVWASQKALRRQATLCDDEGIEEVVVAGGD